MPGGEARFPSPKSEALKPMLWYLAATLVPAAATAFSGRETVTYIMLGFAGLGVLSFLAAYWWLLIKHPDRPQSEAYTTRLLGDQRKEGPEVQTSFEPLP